MPPRRVAGSMASPSWASALRVRALERFDAYCERQVASRKRELLGALSGKILELGPGAGINFNYYRGDIEWTGIEPDSRCHARLHVAAADKGLRIRLCRPSDDRFDLPDACFDAVVGTFVLCTVPNPRKTLGEIRRVLTTGGKFVFVEHVAAAPGTALRALQRACRSPWMRFADGCSPDADTLAWIRGAGFSRVEATEFSIAAPLISPHVAGVALV